jgi:subtilisin family serine protease
MAHARDRRRAAYWETVRDHLGDKIADVTEGLDQFVYDPGMIVYAPPPNTEPGLVDEEVERVVAFLNAGGNNGVARQRQGLNRFLIPVQGDADSRELTDFVNKNEFTGGGTFAGRVAPLSYMVSQQVVQPGEDPEAAPPNAALMLTPVEGATLGSGVTVHIIDTGIDERSRGVVAVAAPLSTHGDHIEELADPTEPPTDPRVLGPAAGHGTFIASLIRSVAPGAALICYRTTDALGLVSEVRLTDVIQDVIAAIRKDEAGMHVVNLSLGGYPAFADKRPSRDTSIDIGAFLLLEAAIAGIPDHVAVVAAAGNCGSTDRFYPAAFDGVVAVAALAEDGSLWEHSNAGDWVDACARGVALTGRFVKGVENPKYEEPGRAVDQWLDDENYATWTGTSFAAPLVAAQIAIVASQLRMHDTRVAADHLLAMSKVQPSRSPRACGKRILVDVPGQT